MNRRQLFKALGGSAIALASADLWTPSRTYFLPPKGGWALSAGDSSLNQMLTELYQAGMLDGFVGYPELSLSQRRLVPHSAKLLDFVALQNTVRIASAPRFRARP